MLVTVRGLAFFPFFIVSWGVELTKVLKEPLCHQSRSLACLISAFSRMRLCMNGVRSLLSMLLMLLGYGFEPGSNSRAPGTAG